MACSGSSLPHEVEILKVLGLPGLFADPERIGWPALIGWAVVTMELRAACRKTSSRTRHRQPARSMRSASTRPGPTDGNWSRSPTISRVAPVGKAE